MFLQSCFTDKIVILFFFTVLQFTWPVQCDERNFLREFEEFAFPDLLNNQYSNLDDGPAKVVCKKPITEFSDVLQVREFSDYQQKTESRSPYAATSSTNKQCTDIDDKWRFDCHPEKGAKQDKCEARGCCWSAPKYKPPKSRRPSDAASLGVPWCFYPTDYPTYTVKNFTKEGNIITVFTSRNSSSYYGNDVMLLRWDITIADNIIRTKIYDPLNKRYEVPINYPGLQPDKAAASILTDIHVMIEKPFTIKIVRKSTKEEIMQFTAGPMIYTDQFIQMSSTLPGKYLYGLGERRDSFLRSLNWQKFTMFAAGETPKNNTNLYGSHPFFLTMTETGEANGGFLLNSNAIEAILQPAPAITFRTLGGILDVYTFLGPTPADVIKQYTSVIGTPVLPPYWSLGFHLCRYNYGSANRTRVIWQRTRDAHIPFDVQWNDIDYMDNWRDFTYDKKKYAELPKLIDDIHDAGMHFIPIVDPAIDLTDTPGIYPPYDEGMKQGIFINDSNGKPFVGKVWSLHGALWPDFTNPKTDSYWAEQLTNFHKQIPFDGLWIDMNEPANFYNGTKDGCPNSKYEHPPYTPDILGGKLSYQTVCMSAQQHASIHYDVHNLYGFTETIATNKALKAIRNKRPFIISRSTFPGQGSYGGHWSGDIISSWDDMRNSIPEMLDFNLFGIPLVGADICGFRQNTTVKLCQRWMELGAFYPFSRNHNDADNSDQDPVALGPDVVQASIKALRMRYMLLPYLYTLFYRANQFGETVVRPLFFEFPLDKKTYAIDTQFMWGSSVMIVPGLQEDVTLVDAYLPAGIWYLLENFKPIHSTGQPIGIGTPLDTIHVMFRSGHIIPFQAVGNTTTDSRKKKFGLIVAFDDESHAEGELYWDDGDSLGTIEDGAYNLLKFTANQNVVISSVLNYGTRTDPMTLGFTIVMGLSRTPQHVAANGNECPFKYHPDRQILIAYNMSLPMENTITISWTYPS